MKINHMSFGEQERVLLLARELEAQGYTRAESEVARGPREYYLAPERIKVHYLASNSDIDESPRMVLIWDSEN
jgi:hypothetical protein